MKVSAVFMLFGAVTCAVSLYYCLHVPEGESSFVRVYYTVTGPALIAAGLAGLRIYCADRKKTWKSQANIHRHRRFSMDFCS